jgi:DNA topoisomerase VI subunit B
LGVSEPVVIESRGVRHELAVRADPGGGVAVDHITAPWKRTVGASVTVPLPADIDIDPWRWAAGAALVNPHATITVTEHGDSDDDDEPVSYKPTDPGWSKWTPNQPASAHWYDRAAFAGLVYAHIRYARAGGPDKPLGEFIREFDGLSSTTKAKAVRASVGGGGPGAVTHLSQLDGNIGAIERLHSAMRCYTKPMPARRLGPVGAAHIERVLDELYGVRRFWYKSATETVAGVGWIVEVAVGVGDTDTEGGPWFAVNHSPSFDDPLGAANLTCMGRWGVWGSGTGPLLSVDDNDYAAAVVHVICTSAQFTDKGKIRLVVPPAVADAAGKALAAATKVLRAEAEQRRKDAAKARRDAQRAREAANTPPTSAV